MTFFSFLQAEDAQDGDGWPVRIPSEGRQQTSNCLFLFISIIFQEGEGYPSDSVYPEISYYLNIDPRQSRRHPAGSMRYALHIGIVSQAFEVTILVQILW